MSVSRFELNPTSLDIRRSRFDRSENYKTTFDAGQLIPFYAETVYPGDSVKIDVTYLIRQLTPAIPVMDVFYLDIEFFFVPWIQIWEHTKQFFGENDTTAWTQTTEYTIPQAPTKANISTRETTGWSLGTIGNYLGLPEAIVTTARENSEGYYVSAMPGRAYVKVWNDWFRDQNYQNAMLLNVTDSNYLITGNQTIAGTTYQQNAGYGISPLPTNKLHDYYTSVLPQAQKGDPVEIGIVGTAPLSLAATAPTGSVTSTATSTLGNSLSLTNPRFVSTDDLTDNPAYFRDYQGNYYNLGGSGTTQVTSITGTPTAAITTTVNSTFSGNPMTITGSADLSEATSVTINQLRWAIQLQKFYETDARYGTRYQEMLLGHFGVRGPNMELYVSEFLGGHRQSIAMDTIIAQSAGSDGSDTSIFGQLGGYQNKLGKSGNMVSKSFTQHGVLLGVFTVRTHQSYPQGLKRDYMRKRRFDFYDPKFANIGEQAVVCAEYNVTPSNKPTSTNNLDTITGTFGYQEAWADLRTGKDTVTGALNPVWGDLAIWTYAVDPGTTTVASGNFMAQGRDEVDRSLKIQGQNSQFLIDLNIKADYIRPMPVYSIPGLMDHH